MVHPCMQKTLEMKMTADEAAEIKAAIEVCHRGMRRLFKEMEEDQKEIEKLKTETRAILARLSGT